MSKKATKFSLTARLQSARAVYREFPRQFWVLIGAAFIDRLGGAMLFPFFTLYLTRKFAIGMTEVGLIFGIFAITGVVGGMAGGALTDRLGRKGMLMFGLVMSALSSVLMGVVDQIELFFLVVLLVGVMAETGGPAQQALVADLLPEEKRAQGFGILRVVFNLAVTIGPLIGGLLASRSYLLLFVVDAVTSVITAVIVYFALKETWRPKERGEPEESMLQSFRGYGGVLKDKAFLWYLVASALMVLVYMQMNTTLAVYLRDYHGVDERGFSYILSLNAGMVVLFQFSITRWVSRFRPLIIMVAGTLLYAVGFALYGFVSAFVLFLAAMAIITIGEMMVSPVGQAIVARLAPEAKRGRYMAVFGFSWIIPVAVGPILAGMVLDNLNPDLLWYAAGIVGIVAALAFFLLQFMVDRDRWAAVDQRMNIIEQLEQGRLTAEVAAARLHEIVEGAWTRLSPEASAGETQNVRFRVSDQASGTTRLDLRLPVGLVNIVLHMGGTFSDTLERYDSQRLKELVASSTAHGQTQQMNAGDENLEVSIE